jgi:hypothetical protein
MVESKSDFKKNQLDNGANINKDYKADTMKQYIEWYKGSDRSKISPKLLFELFEYVPQNDQIKYNELKTKIETTNTIDFIIIEELGKFLLEKDELTSIISKKAEDKVPVQLVAPGKDSALGPSSSEPKVIPRPSKPEPKAIPRPTAEESVNPVPPVAPGKEPVPAKAAPEKGLGEKPAPAPVKGLGEKPAPAPVKGLGEKPEPVPAPAPAKGLGEKPVPAAAQKQLAAAPEIQPINDQNICEYKENIKQNLQTQNLLTEIIIISDKKITIPNDTFYSQFNYNQIFYDIRTVDIEKIKTNITRKIYDSCNKYNVIIYIKISTVYLYINEDTVNKKLQEIYDLLKTYSAKGKVYKNITIIVECNHNNYFSIIENEKNEEVFYKLMYVFNTELSETKELSNYYDEIYLLLDANYKKLQSERDELNSKIKSFQDAIEKLVGEITDETEKYKAKTLPTTEDFNAITKYREYRIETIKKYEKNIEEFDLQDKQKFSEREQIVLEIKKNVDKYNKFINITIEQPERYRHYVNYRYGNYLIRYVKETDSLWWVKWVFSVPPCARSRLIQSSGTCWMNAALNVFILTPKIRHAIINRFNELKKNGLQMEIPFDKFSSDNNYTLLELLLSTVNNLFIKKIKAQSTDKNIISSIAARVKSIYTKFDPEIFNRTIVQMCPREELCKENASCPILTKCETRILPTITDECKGVNKKCLITDKEKRFAFETPELLFGDRGNSGYGVSLLFDSYFNDDINRIEPSTYLENYYSIIDSQGIHEYHNQLFKSGIHNYMSEFEEYKEKRGKTIQESSTIKESSTDEIKNNNDIAFIKKKIETVVKNIKDAKKSAIHIDITESGRNNQIEIADNLYKTHITEITNENDITKLQALGKKFIKQQYDNTIQNIDFKFRNILETNIIGKIFNSGLDEYKFDDELSTILSLKTNPPFIIIINYK